MKKFIKFILLFLVYLAAFLVIYFLILFFVFGKNEALKIENFKVWKNVQEKSFDEIVNNGLSIDDGSIISENEKQDRFYYDQLSDTAKTIYDVIVANRELINKGNETIPFNDGTFDDILMQKDGMSILSREYQCAVDSLRYDDVTWFYVDFTQMALKTVTYTRGSSKWFKVELGPAEENGSYIAEEYQTRSIEAVLETISDKKDEILENAEGTNYQKIKYVHDYLVDNISYDESYDLPDTRNIYGALISKQVVCEGYAKTFKYLMDELNIPCIIISGTATNSEEVNESHMWNYVELNGIWYSIDVTWDDPILINDGQISKESKYRYFCQGDNISVNHFISYTLTDTNKEYEYPTLYHKKIKQEEE